MMFPPSCLRESHESEALRPGAADSWQSLSRRDRVSVEPSRRRGASPSTRLALRRRSLRCDWVYQLPWFPSQVLILMTHILHKLMAPHDFAKDALKLQGRHSKPRWGVGVVHGLKKSTEKITSGSHGRLHVLVAGDHQIVFKQNELEFWAQLFSHCLGLSVS